MNFDLIASLICGRGEADDLGAMLAPSGLRENHPKTGAMKHPNPRTIAARTSVALCVLLAVEPADGKSLSGFAIMHFVFKPLVLLASMLYYKCN